MKYLWAFLTAIVWKDLFKHRYAIRFHTMTFPEPYKTGNGWRLQQSKPVAVCSEVPFRRPWTISYNEFVSYLSSAGHYNVVTGHKFILRRLGNIGSTNDRNFKNAMTIKPIRAKVHILVASSVERARAMAKDQGLSKNGDVTAISSIYPTFDYAAWEGHDPAERLLSALNATEAVTRFLQRQPKNSTIVLWYKGLHRSAVSMDVQQDISKDTLQDHPFTNNVIQMAESIWVEFDDGTGEREVYAEFFSYKHRTWRHGVAKGVAIPPKQNDRPLK